jgi:integrase
MLATLLRCGLRRAELVKLKIEDLDQREEHWVIVNLVGKGLSPLIKQQTVELIAS